jgi:hypothetical protein
MVSSFLFKVVQKDQVNKTQIFLYNNNAYVSYVLVLLFLEAVCHDLKGKILQS